MAANTDPRAKELVPIIRQDGDNLLGLYYELKRRRAQAKTDQNWGAPFNGEATDTIDDGTTTPPTNYAIGSIMAVADDFITFMEASNRVNLLLNARRVG